MLAPKMAAKSGIYRKKYDSKRQAVPEWFFDGFCVEDKQPGRRQSLYLSLGIPVSNAYRRLQHRHRNLFVLAGNMGPCWPSKSWKIAVRGASGRLLGALGGSLGASRGALGRRLGLKRSSKRAPEDSKINPKTCPKTESEANLGGKPLSTRFSNNFA